MGRVAERDTTTMNMVAIENISNKNKTEDGKKRGEMMRIWIGITRH